MCKEKIKLIAEDVEVVALVKEEDGEVGGGFDEAEFGGSGEEVSEVSVATVGDEGDE